jgi:hypothetical protein
MNKKYILSGACSTFLLLSTSAQAATLYGINASLNQEFKATDTVTGSDHSIASPSTTLGIGIATDGSTIYTSTGQNGTIYKSDLNGIQTGSIATPNQYNWSLAYGDGFLWSLDTFSSNKVFKIDPNSGSIASTFTLALATPYATGIEYFDGKLIANRGNGSNIYDVYDLSGGLLTANFIDASTSALGRLTDGIAYDGNNFYIATTNNNTIGVYNSNGAYQSTIDNGEVYYDIAIARTNSNAQTVPEPFTIVGTIIGGTAAMRLRKRLKK